MKRKILATASILAGTMLVLSCTDKTVKEPTVNIVHECLGTTCLLTGVPGDDVMLTSVAGSKHRISHENLGAEQISDVTWTFPSDAEIADNGAIENAFGPGCGDSVCTVNSNPTAVVFKDEKTAQTVKLAATINGFTTQADATEVITPEDEDPTSITATGSCDGQVCTLTSALDTTTDTNGLLGDTSKVATYKWEMLNDGTPTESVGNFSNNASKDTTFTFNGDAPLSTYTARVTLSNFGSSELKSTTTQLNYVPVAGFSIVTDSCASPLECTFTINNPSFGNGAEYKWNLPTGATATSPTAQTTVIKFAKYETKYTIGATVTAGGQAETVPSIDHTTDDKTGSVTIGDVAVNGYILSATAKVTDATVSQGDAYTFTVSNGSFAEAKTYPAQASATFTHNLAPSSAPYTVTVKVATDDGELSPTTPATKEVAMLGTAKITENTCTDLVCKATAEITDDSRSKDAAWTYKQEWTATGTTGNAPIISAPKQLKTDYTYTSTQTDAGAKFTWETTVKTNPVAPKSEDAKWDPQPVKVNILVVTGTPTANPYEYEYRVNPPGQTSLASGAPVTNYSWKITGGSETAICTDGETCIVKLAPSSKAYTVEAIDGADKGDTTTTVDLSKVTIDTTTTTCAGLTCTAHATFESNTNTSVWNYTFAWTSTGSPTVTATNVDNKQTGTASADFVYTAATTGAGAKLVLGSTSVTATPDTTENQADWATQPVDGVYACSYDVVSPSFNIVISKYGESNASTQDCVNAWNSDNQWRITAFNDSTDQADAELQNSNYKVVYYKFLDEIENTTFGSDDTTKPFTAVNHWDIGNLAPLTNVTVSSPPTTGAGSSLSDIKWTKVEV